jgi:hypothetical protein
MNSLTALGIEKSQIFRYVAKSPLVKSKGLAFELSPSPVSPIRRFTNSPIHRFKGSRCGPFL